MQYITYEKVTKLQKTDVLLLKVVREISPTNKLRL